MILDLGLNPPSDLDITYTFILCDDDLPQVVLLLNMSVMKNSVTKNDIQAVYVEESS